MSPAFAGALQAFIAASGGRISITSGYRSPQRQQQLWNDAIARYGDPEIADNWVARPGHSNHERGIAADLHFADAAAREWAHANAARFGLRFPMSWEPWHIEPLGGRLGDRGAYTTPPPGYVNPTDQAMEPEDLNDPGVQMNRLINILTGGNELADMMSADTSMAETPATGGEGTADATGVISTASEQLQGRSLDEEVSGGGLT